MSKASDKKHREHLLEKLFQQQKQKSAQAVAKVPNDKEIYDSLNLLREAINEKIPSLKLVASYGLTNPRDIIDGITAQVKAQTQAPDVEPEHDQEFTSFLENLVHQNSTYSQHSIGAPSTNRGLTDEP